MCPHAQPISRQCTLTKRMHAGPTQARHLHLHCGTCNMHSFGLCCKAHSTQRGLHTSSAWTRPNCRLDSSNPRVCFCCFTGQLAVSRNKNTWKAPGTAEVQPAGLLGSVGTTQHPRLASAVPRGQFHLTRAPDRQAQASASASKRKRRSLRHEKARNHSTKMRHG